LKGFQGVKLFFLFNFFKEKCTKREPGNNSRRRLFTNVDSHRHTQQSTQFSQPAADSFNFVNEIVASLRLSQLNQRQELPWKAPDGRSGASRYTASVSTSASFSRKPILIRGTLILKRSRDQHSKKEENTSNPSMAID
jgi:hypothetical protein